MECSFQLWSKASQINEKTEKSWLNECSLIYLAVKSHSKSKSKLDHDYQKARNLGKVISKKQQVTWQEERHLEVKRRSSASAPIKKALRGAR
jgi:hypothetical protein